MKYEKATVKIYDMGNEEILTCSGDIGHHNNCTTTGKTGLWGGWWSWWNWFGWWG